jgi:hypothetical protein
MPAQPAGTQEIGAMPGLRRSACTPVGEEPTTRCPSSRTTGSVASFSGLSGNPLKRLSTQENLG